MAADHTTAEGAHGPEAVLGERPGAAGFAGAYERLRARALELDAATEDDPLDALDRLLGGADEPTPTPAAIGRYEVLERIGEGGMGVVYLARDRSLERLLAIKLIGGDGGGSRADDGARLQREARAMARLSHPNVVTVHEVGEHDGRLFIAMEYVRGASLTSWLAAAPRSWEAIVAVFIAGGEGLAAAHTAGVIHRDFKPDNVLVGDDGRVRVADFGLAWTGVEAPDDAPTARLAFEDETTLDDEAPLTETGAVLGTLAYMAPEQYRGSSPSVAADIFSFCVSLHRALYGRLPYDTDSPALYRARALAGEVAPAPRGAAVPGWLRAVALRGLAVRPEDRWGSMEELLAALRRSVAARRRRRYALLGAGALGALGLTLGLSLVGAEAAQEEGACAAPEAGLVGIWDGPTRERLGRRVRATSGAGDPSRLWRSVDRLLDLYGDRWLLERTRACQGSRGEAPLAGPIECLDRGREQLAAVVQQLDSGAIDAESAVLAVTGLPAPELCREAPPGALVATADPHRRRQALAAAKAIARASADVDVGRLEAARTGVAETIEIAEAIASPALVAEAELTRGRIDRAERRSDAARATLERARARIHGAPEHRALELRALIQLVDVVGVGQGELAEAEALAVEARALAGELGDPPLLEAYLENNLARVYRAHGRLDAASAGYLDAYALLRQVLGDSAPETIAARANLGVVQSLLGEPEAVAILEHALEQQLSALGEDHPRTPALLRNLGNALGRRGAYARAETVLRRAADLRAAINGENSPERAGDLVSLARVLRGQERLEDADVALRRAAAIFAAAGEPPSSAMASERRALDAAIADAA